MTSSNDTQKPSQLTLLQKAKVERLNEDFDNPHFALYYEWSTVYLDRIANFDMDYMGILGALKMLENDIIQGMNDE